MPQKDRKIKQTELMEKQRKSNMYAVPTEQEKKNIHIAAAVGFFIMPVVVYVILSVIYTYNYGDITTAFLEMILAYVITILKFPLVYILCGLTCFCIYKYGIKNSVPVITAAYISMLIKYIGEFLNELLFSSYFSSYIFEKTVNLISSYLLNAAVFTLIILIAYFVSKSKGSGNPKQNKNPKKTLNIIFISAAAVLFTAGFINTTINVADFIYELKYEYYSSMTANEFVSIVTDYFMLAAEALGGYIIMRLTLVAAALKINESEVLPDNENGKNIS